MLTIEQRLEELHKQIVLAKINPCHTSAGSPAGGEFCETGGGGGIGSSSASLPPTIVESSGVSVAVGYPPLDDAEIAGLWSYKSSGFATINDILLGKPSTESESNKKYAQKHIAGISSVMARSSLTKDTSLHRGMSGEVAKTIFDLPVGSVFSVPSFQSTTTSRGVAAEFASKGSPPPVMFKILAPAGTKAILIEKMIKMVKMDLREKEVVLDKGLQYRITGKDTKPGRTMTMNLEVVK